MRQRFTLVPLAANAHFQAQTDSRLKPKTSPDTGEKPVIEEFTMGPPSPGGVTSRAAYERTKGRSKKGFVSQVGLQRYLLLQSFKYYLYCGDVPCILALTDNLRAQVDMFRQAALEEAVIHHFSHINGSADGSSTSL